MLVPQFLEAYFLNPILLKRDILREQGKYDEADEVRNKLSEIGFKVIDYPYGSRWEFNERKLQQLREVKIGKVLQ